jgi:membrane associated rhomboid family serine protease
VLTTTVALLILAGFGIYIMTPEERARLADAVRSAISRAIEALKESPSSEPFNDFLRARTGRTVVTPVLIALNVAVFVLMLFGSGSLSDPQTLVNWGANFAPRTTNGEWWRLLFAMFVHTGIIHLLITIGCLLSLGFVLERAVGSVPFAAVYFAAGILANVVNLWSAPALTVSSGASGAVYGLYGLLLASLTWTLVGRPDGSIPLTTAKRIGGAAGVFVLYNLITDHLSATGELTGLTAGVVTGLVVARGIVRAKPPVERAYYVTAASLMIAVLTVAPVRGTIDVRSEIASVVAVEERTAGAYNAAVTKFRNGSVNAQDLGAMIDQSIVPELQSARVRLQSLRGVPREHRRVLGDAEEYLQLRAESWRQREEALRDSDTDMLREADRTEQAALNAFQKIKSAR